MQIEIIYALPEKANIIRMQVNNNCTVLQALEQASVLLTKLNIDFMMNNVGIYGQKVGLDHRLKAGDRIEIYRPLLADPKEIRRKRIKQST